MPGRLWYAVAAAIFLATLGGAAWIVVSGVSTMGKGLYRVSVPGSTDLDLDEAGTYSVLQEPVREGTPPDIAGLRVTVRAANGTEIAVRSIGTTPTDTFGPGGDKLVLMFDIETPDTYRLTAAYEDGRRQPRDHLIVSGGMIGGMLRIVIALGIALVGISAAVVMVIVVAVRRRRALRS
jgi:hypothetical protein